MLSSYFKTALRNLWRNRTYSFINILGLSVGLASTFMILIYSVHELSYDRSNKKINRIYMVITDIEHFNVNEPEAPYPLGPTLKAGYPGIEAFARCDEKPCSIKVGQRIFNKIPCVSADQSIFKILTLPIASGSLTDFYTQRNPAVISQQLARKLFGSDDPIGRIIDVEWNGQAYDLNVVAVMKDIPSTSTFRSDCIVPNFIAAESLAKRYASPFVKDPLTSWDISIVTTYLLLSQQNNANKLSADLAAVMKEHSQPNHFSTYMSLHPVSLSRLYFHSSKLANVRFPRGNLTDVRVYSTIALLTLLIACVNFILLTTGRASIRTKEICVRKVVGASRFEIGKQVMIESLIVSVLSLPAALLLVELFMPTFSQLLGKQLPADYYQGLFSIVLSIIVTLLAGILSGSYVSFYLSGFQPASILKNKFTVGQTRVIFRRVLIAFQMVIFIGLIMASITIYQQMRYFHDRNMGFDTRNLVVFSAGDRKLGSNLGERFEPLKKELLGITGVEAVSGGNLLPGTRSFGEFTVKNVANPQEIVACQGFSVDRDFFEAMGMKMLWGRTFREVPGDEAKDAVIMNQTAVKAIGITDPSQQLFQGQRIIGVVRDFNMHSLHDKIAPTFFSDNTEYLTEIAVRLRHLKDTPQTIASVEKVFQKFDGGKKLDYQFFNDRINDMYGSDFKFADMIGYFTGLAIFIACLGLFGMSLFVIQRRVKEIGVRKVLGASVGSILISVAKEFVALLAVSTLVALPISIHFIDAWLSDYAYHIDFNLVTVLVTLFVGMFIVLGTIGYQALKAATTNPVETLRYE